jgi:SnoaL-like domain
MTDFNDIVDGYIAIWNETDEARRRKLIAAIWTRDAKYVDPLAEVASHEGIDALVRGIHEQFPGSQFRRTSRVDAHHNCVRFNWELAQKDGAAFAGGVDVGIFCDGKLQSITGFLDFAPGGANR